MAVVAKGESWVIDGNVLISDMYSAVPEVWERADTIAWLDLPRRVIIPRLIARTARRAYRREYVRKETPQRWRDLFVLDPARSVIAWTWFEQPDLRDAYESTTRDPRWSDRVVRLRTRSEVRAFKRTLGREVPGATARDAQVARTGQYLLAHVPPGDGHALDLGGGAGRLRAPLTARGYAYANIDPVSAGRGAVRGDAERLPFCDAAFDVIVSADSLEHFPDPRLVVAEARRVLGPNGHFVIWVPFLHPFHGDDLWRYTPLGLDVLLGEAGFRVASFESPEWVASVAALMLVELLRRGRLGFLEGPAKRAAARIDRRLTRFQGENQSFARAHLVVATPEV
jgi:SAM-dependent methyltransferase